MNGPLEEQVGAKVMKVHLPKFIPSIRKIQLNPKPETCPELNLAHRIHGGWKTAVVFRGQNLNYFGYCRVLNSEIHRKEIIYVYVQI